MNTKGQEQYEIGELIACVRRELVQRHRVYRRLVLVGTMTEADAEREIALMKAVRDNLQAQIQPSLL